MLLAAAALAAQQWRGRQATLRALGELRKSMARLETLLETAAKTRADNMKSEAEMLRRDKQ